jgi:V8-like Glu-specific endopeptidase
MKRNLGAMTALLCGLGLAGVGCGTNPMDEPGVTQSAITYGQLDGEAHPWVKLLLMEIDGAPAYRCSGTLLSPTVFLTAGHCAGEGGDSPGGEFSGMRVFTDSDVEAGKGITNDYPYAGPGAVEAVAWKSHPQYTSAAFSLHDVGVVILQEPGIILEQYGTLPEVNQLDSLKTQRGLKDVTFTAVGYGMQKSSANPVHDVALRTRMNATPHLLQINVPGFTGDFAMLLSNNPSTGGTCFGDSGGPNFVGKSNVVAGVTSFGINGNCGGTGGVFRVDRANVQDFINSVIDSH